MYGFQFHVLSLLLSLSLHSAWRPIGDVTRSRREEELSVVLPIQSQFEEGQHSNWSGKDLDFTACCTDMNFSTLSVVFLFYSPLFVLLPVRMR